MVRLLVKQVHAVTLAAIRLVVARIAPGAGKRKPLRERPQRRKNPMLITPFMRGAPQVSDELVKRVRILFHHSSFASRRLWLPILA
jgi:hypothetical protein